MKDNQFPLQVFRFSVLIESTNYVYPTVAVVVVTAATVIATNGFHYHPQSVSAPIGSPHSHLQVKRKIPFLATLSETHSLLLLIAQFNFCPEAYELRVGGVFATAPAQNL